MDFDKSRISTPGHFYRGTHLGPAGHMYTTHRHEDWCHTEHTAHIDRFEGPPEARSRVSIFPLSGSVGGQLRAGHSFVTEGRLAPPELSRTGRTGSWPLWPGKDGFLRSERNGHL